MENVWNEFFTTILAVLRYYGIGIFMLTPAWVLLIAYRSWPITKKRFVIGGLVLAFAAFAVLFFIRPVPNPVLRVVRQFALVLDCLLLLWVLVKKWPR